MADSKDYVSLVLLKSTADFMAVAYELKVGSLGIPGSTPRKCFSSFLHTVDHTKFIRG